VSEGAAASSSAPENRDLAEALRHKPVHAHGTHLQRVATIDHDVARHRQFGWAAHEHLLERNVHRALLVTVIEGLRQERSSEREGFQVSLLLSSPYVPGDILDARSKIRAREPVEWPALGMGNRKDEHVLLVFFERDDVWESVDGGLANRRAHGGRA
jgi:hypothetical protein